MSINKENLQQSLICFTLSLLIIIIIIYFLSLCTRCICVKCRGRTLNVYVEDKCCVKYQTAQLMRKELIFTVGLTTNFDVCMPNVVGTY